MRGEYYAVCVYNDLLYGITPACAGNTFSRPAHGWALRDHPRMRGEYILEQRDKTFEEGSPPHARGILITALGGISAPGITPACAGNTPCLVDKKNIHRDHPRMRGEYKCWRWQSWSKPGSPPHARGILIAGMPKIASSGITPACAGNTLQDTRCGSLVRDHPRMRGEYCTRQ